MFQPKILNRYSEREPQKGLSFAGTQSRAKQEFAADCDINTIVSRFLRAGVVPMPTSQPVFADVSDGRTYHALQNQIAYVKQVFADLPADVRADFHNDPAEMLDWVSDPKNADEARKLGLLPGSGNSSSLGVTVPTDTEQPASDEQGPAPVGSGKPDTAGTTAQETQ